MLFFNHQAVNKCLQAIQMKLKQFPRAHRRPVCHSVPENEISIWSDELQVQQEKLKVLNDTVQTLADGQASPILYTLNTTWDDISSTQQKHYQRKAKETITAALSVISLRQEEKLWHALRKEATIGSA